MHTQHITIIKTVTINTTITPRPGIRRQIAQTPDPAECRPILARDLASHVGYGRHHDLQAARHARCVRTRTQSGRPATDTQTKSGTPGTMPPATATKSGTPGRTPAVTGTNQKGAAHQIARQACQAKRPCRQGDWRQHRPTLYFVEIHDVAIDTVVVLA